jgi:hypothetical protein
MGWRRELEDRYTVACAGCGQEYIEPAKRPGQKFLLGRPCVNCGHLRKRQSPAAAAPVPPELPVPLTAGPADLPGRLDLARLRGRVVVQEG